MGSGTCMAGGERSCASLSGTAGLAPCCDQPAWRLEQRLPRLGLPTKQPAHTQPATAALTFWPARTPAGPGSRRIGWSPAACLHNHFKGQRWLSRRSSPPGSTRRRGRDGRRQLWHLQDHRCMRGGRPQRPACDARVHTACGAAACLRSHLWRSTKHPNRSGQSPGFP